MYEENSDFPKVLVVSHNVFSLTSNMGRTLANFFTEWPSEKLAQIYFHMQIPTMEICERYYRITDFDMIKKSRENMGTLFGVDDIRKDLKTERVDEGVESKIYQKGRKRRPYMYIGRNLLWATGKWKNKKLLDWIDEFNPDVIFFASSDYIFPYKITMKIAKYKKIPILTYVCDDYYFLKKKSISPLYHINKSHFNSTVKKLFARHKNMIGICDKLSKDYSKEFNVHAETFMTLSSMQSKNITEKKDIQISYLGNLGYNRNLILAEIGKVLAETFEHKYFIDVYSPEIREEVLECLKKENGIRFNGSVAYDEVERIMKESDILIHCESFDDENRNKVRYSVSTKIADSLSSGTVMLAYGPEDIASIEYLKENGCACVATSLEELGVKLKELIENDNLRKEYANKAIEVAMVNHKIETNCKRFNNFINEIAE